MSTDAAEAQAQQVMIEVTKKGVEVVGTLSAGTWRELRTVVAHAAERVRNGRTIGGKVNMTRLEELTRGQRDQVKLTDPRVARRLKAELKKDGVTFAVTRGPKGERRVHIGAGNAPQMDAAMQRAQEAVNKSIGRKETRTERMRVVRREMRNRLGLADLSQSDTGPEQTRKREGRTTPEKPARDRPQGREKDPTSLDSARKMQEKIDRASGPAGRPRSQQRKAQRDALRNRLAKTKTPAGDAPAEALKRARERAAKIKKSGPTR